MEERKTPSWLKGVPAIDFDALARAAPRAAPELADAAEAAKRYRGKGKKPGGKVRPVPKGRPGGLAWRIARVMEPGRWYGRPDLLTLTGMDYSPLKMVTQRMWRAGVTERAENPEWRPVVYRKGEGIHKTNKGTPPRWLYRLTGAGVEFRDTSDVERKVNDQCQGCGKAEEGGEEG